MNELTKFKLFIVASSGITVMLSIIVLALILSTF